MLVVFLRVYLGQRHDDDCEIRKSSQSPCRRLAEVPVSRQWAIETSDSRLADEFAVLKIFPAPAIGGIRIHAEFF